MVQKIQGASTPPQAPASQPSSNTSTVQKGETFSQFAQRNNVSEPDLKKANPNVDPAQIQQGQELKLPARPAQADTQAAPQTSQRLDSEGRAARVAEHNIEGQARAAQLESQAAPAGTGTPSGSGTPTTGTGTPAGTPATSGAPAGTTGTGPASAVQTPPLKNGSKGPEVENLQTQLNDWRTQQGQGQIGVDGKYGNETQRAVTDFQRSNGLTTDGQAGARTRDRLALETDPNFRSLTPATQDQIRNQMNTYSTQQAGRPDTPENQSSRTNLMGLATDPNFARLSPEGQNAALQRLQANPTDAAQTQEIRNTVRDRANLENNANFRNLNADTRTQVLTRMEALHGDSNQAARTNLSNLATDPNFSQLSRTHQDQTLRALERNPADAAYTQQLRDLTGSPNFRNMDDALKTRALNFASTNATNPAAMQSLDRMIRHDRFGAMSTADQGMMMNVFEGTSARGREALQNLMNRDVGGSPALTSRGYGATGTLLEQLNRASTTSLDTRMTGVTRQQFTENLLNEVSDPNHYIDQSNRDTCTVTSMSHNLALRNPAEYARIATDLGTTGQSRLANGDTIQAPADAFAPDTSTRSDSERLMQSAFMNYARPGQGYTNLPQPGRFADGQTGLVWQEQERVLEGLHNRDYEHYTGSFNFRNDQRDILERTRTELANGRGPVHTRFSWGGGGHAVEVTEIRDGRVYFRNPWGGDQPGIGTDVGPNGTTVANPAVRTDDARNGIQSMTVDEYLRNIRGVIVPD